MEPLPEKTCNSMDLKVTSPEMMNHLRYCCTHLRDYLLESSTLRLLSDHKQQQPCHAFLHLSLPLQIDVSPYETPSRLTCQVPSIMHTRTGDSYFGALRLMGLKPPTSSQEHERHATARCEH